MDRSSTNTPTPSEASSTAGHRSETPSLFHPQVNSAGNPLPPLCREYPLPKEPVDVAEALARPPLRWTIKGTMAAGEHRQIRVKTDEEKTQEFAQAKADLVKASASLNNLPNIDRRSPSS
ncbi:hypothetical protein Cpir12675_002513 [Ceratocystis pirilliformis]|uniref:Uncharacterized protein n=1 Tax=Ceratocystis pirilliformis TaxID=259994 RepID=A0ABR3ZAP4_9PEZI